MRHFVIRVAKNGEPIGIVKIPLHSSVWFTLHCYMDDSDLRMVTTLITEVEYTSFKEFKLFPVYEYSQMKEPNPAAGYVIVYDPRYFVEDESIITADKVRRISLKSET